MEDVDLGLSTSDAMEEDRRMIESRQEYENAVVLDECYGISPKKLKEMLLLDVTEASIYSTFLRRMKYFDVSLGDFATHPGGNERLISFKISSPMGSVGPKEVDAEDSQELVMENSAGLIMESTCKTSKVMYANSFRVCVQHKITAPGNAAGAGGDFPAETSMCRLRCTLRVHFVKSVMGMIKKQIRTETVKQTKKKYAVMAECIRDALAAPSSAPLQPLQHSHSAPPHGQKASPLQRQNGRRRDSRDDDGAGNSVNNHRVESTADALPPLADGTVSLRHRRNMSMTNLKRDTSKSDTKVTGWLLKRSNTLRKWNTRYCEFDFMSGRFEWRKRPDDVDPNGFMMINKFTEIQTKDVSKGERGIHPQGMEECGFVIHYEKKKFYFSADTDRAMDMWCTAIKEYIQSCTTKVHRKQTSFDDTSPMMVRLSIGEAIGLDHLDQEKASERMVYFKMSVGRHVKRSRTVSTGKSDAGAWNQTFCFPIFIHENPEIIIVGEECHSDQAYTMGKQIGMCSLPLWAFPPGQGVKFWSCLRSSAHMSSPISGKVRVHLLIQQTSETTEADWETKNDVHEVFDDNPPAKPKANGIPAPLEMEEGDPTDPTESGPFEWRDKASLLSLLCCGLPSLLQGKAGKRRSQDYQLLNEMEEL